MKFRILIQYCLPHHALSRIVGSLTKCRWPWFKNVLIHWFIKRHQIDMSCLVEKNPNNYSSFNEFFTRALRPETRPIKRDENAIISPIDGYISQIGKITNNQLIQAKGHKYTLADLFGEKIEYKIFNDGNYATLYLSPKDYHRVHMPFTGKLINMVHIPGKLFSVNPFIINEIPNLYTRNERVINLFETKIGPVAIVLIGAMLVASIETVWAGEVAPAGRKKIRDWSHLDDNIELVRGAEMGRFQFGSTVILLFPKNTITWGKNLMINDKIIVGQKLGEFL